MNRLFTKFGKHARVATAAFMTLWLSGVLFLLCGQMPEMQAKDFCPLGKGKSHCDKAKAENDSPLVSTETGFQSFDCCGFLPAVFDKTRKVEKNQQVTKLVDKIKVDLPKFAFTKKDLTVSESYHSASFSKNKTFIKNCIFRI